jgi:actin-related protein
VNEGMWWIGAYKRASGTGERFFFFCFVFFQLFFLPPCSSSLSQLLVPGAKVCVSHPLAQPEKLQTSLCEVMFETYQSGSLLAGSGPVFASYGLPRSGTIVEAGYSQSYCVGVTAERRRWCAGRLDLGGKVMTNVLK